MTCRQHYRRPRGRAASSWQVHGNANMHLASYTDYALRVLLYAGASGQNITISQISEACDISKEHLRKVVHALAQHRYLSTTQGRHRRHVWSQACPEARPSVWR